MHSTQPDLKQFPLGVSWFKCCCLDRKNYLQSCIPKCWAKHGHTYSVIFVLHLTSKFYLKDKLNPTSSCLFQWRDMWELSFYQESLVYILGCGLSPCDTALNIVSKKLCGCKVVSECEGLWLYPLSGDIKNIHVWILSLPWINNLYIRLKQPDNSVFIQFDICIYIYFQFSFFKALLDLVEENFNYITPYWPAQYIIQTYLMSS